MKGRPNPSTFSVVAADTRLGEWGVAVQSKFVAVGSVVPWAEAGAGAIATQALANMSYGPGGLSLLRKGMPAEEVLRRLTLPDRKKEHRPVGIVDLHGRAAAFTGSKCMEWAGHVTEDGFCCQGNILAGEGVVEAMVHAMKITRGDLAKRLLSALEAGQKAGWDRRGQQSAALYVARTGSGYGGTTDRHIDVRVDEHPTPITELGRVFSIYDMTLLTREDPGTLIPLTTDLVRRIQRDLKTLELLDGKASGAWNRATREAWSRYLGVNNFENKERTDGRVWPSTLKQLEESARLKRREG